MLLPISIFSSLFHRATAVITTIRNPMSAPVTGLLIIAMIYMTAALADDKQSQTAATTSKSGTMKSGTMKSGTMEPIPLGNPAKNTDIELDSLYREAQREFTRKNYEMALPLLQQYIESSKHKSIKRNRLLNAIDQVGGIYLRIKQNPDAALKFFKSFYNDERLNDAELNTIEEWIGAATDWKRFGKLPSEIQSADQLYLLGLQYYNKGINKLKYPMDKGGNADFHIAASYLIPFIVNFDNDKRIGETLFYMGDIRRHVLIDNLYWTENYYLKETIRRFPHTPLASKAFEVMQDDVEFAYSGSEGNFTPDSMKEMLDQYRKLSLPSETANKKE